MLPLCSQSVPAAGSAEPLPSSRSAMRRREKVEETKEESKPEEEPELRLVLVGRTGGGKSATGNTILGRKAFESVLGAKTTTVRCQKAEGTWEGRRVSVVDTPALFDSEVCDEVARREIMACIELSRPGPHALILVTQVGRFTAEDVAAAKRVWEVFGGQAKSHTIVLFTCQEDLGGDPLRDYVQGCDNRALRALIGQCGNRFCGFDNRAEGAEREEQVSQLMGLVETVVWQNGGRHYVNDLYLEPHLLDAKVLSYLDENRSTWKKGKEGHWNQILLIGGAVALTLALVMMNVRFPPKFVPFLTFTERWWKGCH